MQIAASMVKELRERTGAGMMECKKALVETGGDIDAAVELMRKSGQAKADKKAGRIAAEGLVAVATSADGTAGVLVEVNCETDFVARETDFQAFSATVAERALAERPSGVEALAGLAIEAGASQTIEERRLELVARIGENMTVRRMAFLDSDGGRIGAYSHGGRIGVLVDVGGGSEEIAKNLAMHVAASSPLAVGEADMPADVLEREREIIRAQVAESGKPPEIQEKMLSGRVAKYLRESTLLGQPYVRDPDQSVEKYLASNGATVSGFIRFEVGEGIERRAENFAEEVMAQVRGA